MCREVSKPLLSFVFIPSPYIHTHTPASAHFRRTLFDKKKVEQKSTFENRLFFHLLMRIEGATLRSKVDFPGGFARTFFAYWTGLSAIKPRSGRYLADERDVERHVIWRYWGFEDGRIDLGFCAGPPCTCRFITAAAAGGSTRPLSRTCLAGVFRLLCPFGLWP